MKIIFLTLIILISFGMTCGNKGQRVDEVKNKALEKLCNGQTALAIYKENKDHAREYICQCQQAAKQSDQNSCKNTIALNNFSSLVETCKKLLGGENLKDNLKKCENLFNAMK